MNHYIQTASTYLNAHKKILINIAIGLGVVVVFGIIAVLIQNSMKYTYEPVKACDLFTPAEAQDLLKTDKVISTDSNAPQVSGSVATSKCSYTDSNPDPNKMRVAAVAVRSAVYQAGVTEIKNDFTKAKANNSSTIRIVKDLGDSAYFNTVNGQLNILQGHNWIIISNGAGSDQQGNTLDNALALARKVL